MGAVDEIERFRQFFAFCPEMLFMLDGSGAILELSEPLVRLLGAEVQKGAPFSALIHPDSLRAFEVGLTALAESDAPVRFDCRVRAADGSSPSFELRARKAPARGEIHGVLRESAAAREPEAATQAQEARLLHALCDSLDIILWCVDRQGIFTYSNGRGLLKIGDSAGRRVGRNFFEPPVADTASERMRNALAGQPVHAVAEAHGVSWESWYVPMHDERGDVDSVAVLTLDLSEVRKAEKELQARIDLIQRQQQVIRALSTPIIEIWDRVLTLPMTGVVDSMRAAEVMDNLLRQVSRKGARFAILDLTGVDAVDTSTASHLLKLIQALRLLGAEGIITGIQPDVAQTMVALGMNLEEIVTLASLRDGLRLCVKRIREEKG
jgi:rsbT co-antagonist protein RsbR